MHSREVFSWQTDTTQLTRFAQLWNIKCASSILYNHTSTWQLWWKSVSFSMWNCSKWTPPWQIYFWFCFFSLLCPQIILYCLNGHSRLSSRMTVHPLGENRAQLQHSNLHWAVWDHWHNICEQWQLALKVVITIISSYLCNYFKTFWLVFISNSPWSDWERSLERFQGIWVTFSSGAQQSEGNVHSLSHLLNRNTLDVSICVFASSLV